MAAADAHLQETLEQAAQGDPDAVERLLLDQAPLVRRTVALRLDRRVSARVDVSDIVQETCLEAMRRLPEYLAKADMPFPLWLRWLALEKTLECHRRHMQAEKRAIGRELPPLPAESAATFVRGLAGKVATPSRLVGQQEVAERVRLALQQLSDEDRELILWRHFEQLTIKEAAQLLKLGEAAAYKRYARALTQLRSILKDLDVSGPT